MKLRSDMPKVLTIAGSDSSGGAGIQADLKTIAAQHMYGMSVITALTAQNTTGVRSIFDASPDFVADEIDAVFEDIRPDAVKIGMLSESGIIDIVASKLCEYEPANVVLDPVMVATSGSRLLKDEAVGELIDKLLPLADIVTPNIPEAEILAEREIKSDDDMIRAAEKIGASGTPVMLKGGHFIERADDLLWDNGRIIWLRAEHIDNPNTHGTGCTLSSAIACGLAGGKAMERAVREAKEYLTGAICAGLDLGHGHGPLDHMWAMETSHD